MTEETPEGILRDGQRAARQYDAMADHYAAHNRQSAFNAYYERPATMALLGSVAGRRVLEVGCGAGPLTEWLVDSGAAVTAMDVSPRMADLARRRLGARAAVLVADAAAPLSFAADGAFDLVCASLLMHYLREWGPVLREFRRVLAPAGAVVFSTHHPAMDWQIHSPDDYFALKQVTETWSGGHEVTFWRRPLTAMTSAIADAGFLIERLVEADPAPELEVRDPDAFRRLRTAPAFVHFRLRPEAAPPPV